MHQSTRNSKLPGLSAPDRELARFWRGALGCDVCATLAPNRKFPPAARGTARYGLMILGEAPGRVSLENQRPFSNPRNLTVRNAFARAVAPRTLAPEALFYFTDAVKCWPASPTGANRSPSNAETATCVGRHLQQETAIIRPRVIFAFGARAAVAALGHPLRLAEVHGQTVENDSGIRVIPLMHPSTINIAGMRRVGIRSLDQYEEELARLFAREIAPVLAGLDPLGKAAES
jgi:uracil-DNA glycosylase family 4